MRGSPRAARPAPAHPVGEPQPSAWGCENSAEADVSGREACCPLVTAATGGRDRGGGIYPPDICSYRPGGGRFHAFRCGRGTRSVHKSRSVLWAVPDVVCRELRDGSWGGGLPRNPPMNVIRQMKALELSLGFTGSFYILWKE